MIKVAVFGGTTEGRHIAEFCDENKIMCSYFTATEAGMLEVDNCRNIEVFQGRLNLNEMKSVFNNGSYTKVIDATHPYAVEVSKNIKQSCVSLSVPYERIVREQDYIEENRIITYLNSIDEVADCLSTRKGNIFVTTGSKDAEIYTKINDFENRVYLRILPDNDTIKKLCGMRFKREHIITGKGPFFLGDNIKMLKDTNSRMIVTKESGKNGGYHEKIKAAEICGCEVFCIRRPKENGISESEAIKRLSDMNKYKVYIIGIGMGNTDFLSSRSKELIKSSDIVIGAERIVSACKELIADSAEIFISYDTNGIVSKINEGSKSLISVLMSGDTGFFSGAKSLAKKLGDRAEIIPGISSLSYLASKIGVPWDDAYFITLHGKKGNLPFAVLTHEKTFVITDGKINEVMHLLKEYHLPGVTVYIGKNLGLCNEQILKTTPVDYTDSDNSTTLVSLFIINNQYENRMRFLHDSEFARNETPMTKESVRNQIIGRFNVKKDSIIYDIGSGTGSVSLMLARLVPDGKVYAFDISEKAIEILEENKRKLSTDHIKCILGEAEQSIKKNNLPLPDAIFIGGSNGNLKQIISLFEGKNIPLVITAVTIETFTEIMCLIEERRIKSPQISQITVNEGTELGSYHILKPQNSVWIISGVL